MPRFTADDLIACYETGVFPMGEAREDARVFLVDPEARGVIPLHGFHLPRRLARTVRADVFEVRVDSAFATVVAACALARPGREETWINTPIERLYVELFARGLAHSVECWREGALLGGLYGVAIGGAFFGESMFSEARDASKVALAHLVARLRIGGYRLLDAQFLTDHLSQFGAQEVGRADYQQMLAAALGAPGDFYRLAPAAGRGGGAAGAGAGASVLQAISQTS